MLAFGGVERLLRLVDFPLPAFTLLKRRRLLPRTFSLALLLLLLVGESGLPFRRLVDRPGGAPRRFLDLRLAASLLWFFVTVAQIGGEFGMLAERSIGADG